MSLPDSADTIVIGAGITGLCAGRALSTRGRRVVVVESAGAPGGLLAPRILGGQPVDSYYHHIFVSDRLTTQLLSELGLGSSLRWRETSVALLDDYGFHALSTPLDVVRFKGLSMGDKARLALLIHRARTSRLEDLDHLCAKEWAVTHAGDEVWEYFLRPLVDAKFGAAAPTVSAAWLAGRIECRSSRGLRGERLGYLTPGFHAVIGVMARELESNLWCSEPATALLVNEDRVSGVMVGDREISCHQVIFTGGVRALRAFLGDSVGKVLPELSGLTSQGVICGAFAVDAPPRGAYWTNVTIRGAPFNVVIQQDLLEPATSDVSIVYASRSIDPDAISALSPSEVLDEFQGALKTLFDIDPGTISDRVLVSAADAGIAYTVGALTRISNLSPRIRGFHLAGMLRSFPDRSIEQSIRHAHECTQALTSL